MSGQTGIDLIRDKNGVGDGSLTPAYHADQLQQVFDEALEPVRRVVDSDTIQPTDHFIDVFPDEGALADVDLTLLAATSYPGTFKCQIINDTAANYVINIKDNLGATLKVIKPANGFTIYKRNGGFDFAQTKGQAPSVLNVATYGNFDAIAWASLPSGDYIINGNGTQFSGFPPQWILNPAATYTFLIQVLNDTGAYLRSMLFYSTTDATNNRIGQELRQAGGNFGGAIASGWKPAYAPDSFAVKSTDTIAVGTEANPSILTGLVAVSPIVGFTVDAALGAVRNVSGVDIARAAGSLAVQPVKTGGGGVSVVSIYSERSTDGVTWVKNEDSLRTFEVPNDGESFLSPPSFTQTWPNGSYVRFRVATDGGTISLTAPSKTLEGTVVSGLSVYWTMTRIG